MADEVVQQIADRIIAHLPTRDCGMLVLLNNLGGTTSMEMSIAARALVRYLGAFT